MIRTKRCIPTAVYGRVLKNKLNYCELIGAVIVSPDFNDVYDRVCPSGAENQMSLIFLYVFVSIAHDFMSFGSSFAELNINKGDFEKLISLVYERNLLWEITCKQYYNRDVSRKLWDKINKICLDSKYT